MPPTDALTIEKVPAPMAAGPVRPISRAEEKAIAHRLSPAIAWPMIGLAVVLPALFLLVALLGWTRAIPLWVCLIPLMFLSYGHYTLVHEAVHGNVVVEPKRWRSLNGAIGWIGAIGLGIGWPFLRRTHVLHHSHTNSPLDPDIGIKGTLPALAGKWMKDALLGLIPFVALKYVSPASYRQLRDYLDEREIRLCSCVTGAKLMLLVLAALTGRLAEWIFLLFLPQQLGVLLLMIFFQWLPHHPFDRTDRYGNTRISLWLGGKIFTFQQNLHLMHHLWPSVPFFNYYRLFVALKPLLLAEGASIQGFGVGSWVEDRSCR